VVVEVVMLAAEGEAVECAQALKPSLRKITLLLLAGAVLVAQAAVPLLTRVTMLQMVVIHLL
jgi:hypothetical protein